MKAVKTLELIDDSIKADQGGSFRQALGRIIPKMDDAYRGTEAGFRKHLGASLIGRECAFELWLSFRWCMQKSFEGQVLRLFNRGHLEEARFLAMLEAAGLEVWYETPEGGQFKFSYHGGHFGSALDAIVKGVPDIPDGAPAYGEFKTHNEKSYAKLAGSKPKWPAKRVGGDGLLNAKYEHYVQMQICMGAYELEYGLYMAVNKDTDELYAEIIKFDQTVFDRYHDRAGMIIFTDEAPARISDSPGWWKCKFCDFKGICHKGETPLKNCRTCVYVTAEQDGTWGCSAVDGNGMATPEAGCDIYTLNPFMTPNDKEGQALWRQG